MRIALVATAALCAVAAASIAVMMKMSEPDGAHEADPSESADAGADEAVFENLRWSYEGPTPMPVPTIGWNESALRAVVTRDGAPHVVVRAPSPDGSGGAVYLLRPISEDGIGDPVGVHAGILGEVLPGDPPWSIVEGGDAPSAAAFGDDGIGTRVFEPADEHHLVGASFWVRDGGIAGAAVTRLRAYAGAARPTRHQVEFPGGGVGVRTTGPRPVAEEHWVTHIGRGVGRPVRVAREPYPDPRRMENIAVAGGASGAVVVLFFQDGRAALADLLGTEGASGPARGLEAVRFDARGRELWRRTLPLDTQSLEPLSAVHADGTAELAWSDDDGSLRVVTLTEREPLVVRTAALEGDVVDHHFQLVRCGGESWIFDTHAPGDDRRVTRRRIEAGSLGPEEPVYRATLSYDGPAPTRELDVGHHAWVDARNGAHLRVELGCDDEDVVVAIDVPTAPSTEDRGLVFRRFRRADDTGDH